MNKQQLLEIINKAAKEKRTNLNLSGKSINSLPPEIGRLTSLKELDLNYNQLTSLPPEIGRLTSLKELNLSANQLTSLPPEIGQLTSLKMLSPAFNELTSLPPEIGRLTSLKMLYLTYNQLTSLPPEIGRLTSLKMLYLTYNQLTSLPPEISRLSRLEELHLSNNELTSLPPEIGHLTGLKVLYLEGNRLELPPEIVSLSHNPSEIINYYLQHQVPVEKRRLNEAKMLFVGQPEVGKTCVVNRLIDGTYKDENTTPGINIRDWNVTADGAEIKLNVWDFGGQETKHATHQFFLTERSLYLLVLDARKGEHDSKIEYWLKLIQSYGGDSPIIVVINKIDQGSLHIDRRGLQKKYPNIKAFIDTSCRENIGIDELKEVIAEQIGRLEHVKSEWLPSWFNVKAKLEKFEKDQIPISEYEIMCEAEKIDPVSRKTLLRYLHDLGIVLCFVDDPRLNEMNILNPEWVTEGVYGILNSH